MKINFDVDFVIPWVDGSDPEWIKEFNKYAPLEKQVAEDSSKERYRDMGLLRYWFRGVEKIAPWVRKVHFVTNGQKPDWLNLNAGKLHWVKHEDYIPKEFLPVFSANPIELYMHKIPSLAEHFVYFNDDFYFANKLLRILRYFLYKKYNNVCVLTKSDKIQYDKLNIRATCIPNAVDFLSFEKIDINAERKKTIIGIGRLEEQKNFSSLIRVFYKVHKKYPDWSLEIYGKGNLHERLQLEIDKFELSGCVHLMGVSNEINKVFQNSGIFVLSSLYEGFSMVIVEAMESGCPVVSYDCPNGPGDLINNEINGLLVENQNEEKLYEAILKMIENSDFRKNCAKNALLSVKQYSIENVFEKWKSLFDFLKGEN